MEMSLWIIKQVKHATQFIGYNSHPLKGKNVGENIIKIHYRMVNSQVFSTESLSEKPPLLNSASFLMLPKHALLLPK